MSLFFFLILFLSFSCLSSAQNDQATLQKIKEQLGYPWELNNWALDSAYCFSQPESEPWWYGHYTCNENRRVNSLYLTSLYYINTTFPSAIFELTELENLTVSFIEGLYGPIPCSIANLRHLTKLEIAFTSLSGPIPSSLAQTNLTSLTLHHNKFSGPIPESLSELKYLINIDLNTNQLTGPIPLVLGHGSPSELISLDLSFNYLSGELPEYYGGPYFSRISLGSNRLSGDASLLFGKEKETSTILLASNSFEFDLSHVEPPSKLEFLDLSSNRIYGSIPQSFKDIYSYNVANNQLCGPIPLGNNSWYSAYQFENNTCLCGVPLPPCCD